MMINKLRKFISKVSLPEYTIISGFAIIIGISVGLAVVLFHQSIEWLEYIFFDLLGENMTGNIGMWFLIFIPAIGMGIQAVMRKMAPETARKKGVTDVIKAVSIRGGHIPFKTTLFHFLAPAICISSGGTVGPEGPAAQIGGGVASKFGRILGIKDSRRKMFTAAGAGAAISAVFNTPLGGIFFALEIILLNDFHSPTFSALILSSVTASAISRIFLGNEAKFAFQATVFDNYEYLYVFIIIGILAGLISLAFIRYSSSTEKFLSNKILTKYPRWLIMSLIGLLVGISGFYYHDILGIGYEFIDKTLGGNISWEVVVVLLLLKFALVPLILNSGGFGGIFAPSLFLGAGFGYLFSLILNSTFAIQVPAVTIILVFMGAMLGGINSIPISSILIIFEMTKDYSFILPLMLAIVISTMIVQIVLKGSVHIKHLEHQGYTFADGKEKNILHSIYVKSVMSKNMVIIPEDTPLPKLMADLLESPQNIFYVKNPSGKITGAITESELRPIITEYEQLRGMLVARDIAVDKCIKVAYSDSLDHVLNRFSKENIDQFLVVHDSDSDKVLGTITRQDILTAYNKESLKYNLAQGLTEELKNMDDQNISHISDGYAIYEREVPTSFIGKTLANLKIRNKYSLEVLMIKKPHDLLGSEEAPEIISPDPEYKFSKGDNIALFGKETNIKEAQQW